MGTWTDMSIFRRFGYLQAQNILYLQAELAHLEDELDAIREGDNPHFIDDEKRADECRDKAQEWQKLMDLGEESDEYLLVMRIREKLNEYSEFSFLPLFKSYFAVFFARYSDAITFCFCCF